MAGFAPLSRLVALLVSLGVLAGLALWGLVRIAVEDVAAPRTVLGLATGAGVFFTLMLSLSGTVAPRRILMPAILSALVTGLLYWWASGRHPGVEPFLQLLYPVPAGLVPLVFGIPILGAALRTASEWRAYPVLFALFWEIGLRLLAALAFLAIFWTLVALSDALLSIVGLALMEALLSWEILAYLLTGGVFGLALGIMHGFSHQLSPALVLRLLRLLLPVVLGVVLVFLAMLPIRGWEGLTGGLSPASILIAFAWTALFFVLVAVDAGGDAAVQGRALRTATAALTLLIPLLAALALWAIWLRVDQYGISPPRLIAGTFAAVALIWGLVFAAVAVSRRDWMARIGSATVPLVLLTMLVSASWLTPLVSPERLAARDHLARALAGHDDIPLRDLARDWGHAGRTALARIEAARPDLGEEIAVARDPLRSGRDPERHAAVSERLLTALPVYPEQEVSLPDLAHRDRERLLQACANALPSGPGCALYLGAFDASRTTRFALLFQRLDTESVWVRAGRLVDGAVLFEPHVTLVGTQAGGRAPIAALDALHAGEARLEPLRWQALRLGDIRLFAFN